MVTTWTKFKAIYFVVVLFLIVLFGISFVMAIPSNIMLVGTIVLAPFVFTLASVAWSWVEAVNHGNFTKMGFFAKYSPLFGFGFGFLAYVMGLQYNFSILISLFFVFVLTSGVILISETGNSSLHQDSQEYQKIANRKRTASNWTQLTTPIKDREVICGDAIKWLHSQKSIPGWVITSLPDYSEVNMDPEKWKIWFTDAATLILEKMQPNSAVIFYQSDVKVLDKQKSNCTEWIDKAHLCQIAAGRTGRRLLWHKIMLLVDVDVVKFGRPTFTHMLCFTDMLVDPVQKGTFPDVMHRGDMIWSRGMGLNACVSAIKWCKAMGATLIVDPFCGKGTILAVANTFGLAALGVELTAKRCKVAQSLFITFDEKMK